jgi:hypothetical protein
MKKSLKNTAFIKNRRKYGKYAGLNLKLNFEVSNGDLRKQYKFLA